MDFDKLFENYVIQWYKEHIEDFSDPSDMEAKMPELYDIWAAQPSQQLNGKSPKNYFDDFSPKQLVDKLIDDCNNDSNPCSLLLDKIVATKDCTPFLRDILNNCNNVSLSMIVVNMLSEQGAPPPLELYVSWLTADIDDGQRELAVEVLCDNANNAAPMLFKLLETKPTNKIKTLIAEILVNANKDDRTFNLLSELFANGDNLPLYASYIGKYGDERASAMLYRAVDTCTYHEYIEIKNAIERMGGVIEIERDFSDDPTYFAIKNIK